MRKRTNGWKMPKNMKRRMEKTLQTALDVFRSGKRNPDEPPEGWDSWARSLGDSYWTMWGLEAEGIPLDYGLVSRVGPPELPMVRVPTPEELEGLKSGARPDLLEKIRNYRTIVKLCNDDITAEAVKALKEKQERRAVRIAKLHDRLRLKLPKEAMSKLRSRLELELKWERRSREREAKILARWCGPLEGRRSG